MAQLTTSLSWLSWLECPTGICPMLLSLLNNKIQWLIYWLLDNSFSFLLLVIKKWLKSLMQNTLLEEPHKTLYELHRYSHYVWLTHYCNFQWYANSENQSVNSGLRFLLQSIILADLLGNRRSLQLVTSRLFVSVFHGSLAVPIILIDGSEKGKP